jgi:hypothetical protein
VVPTFISERPIDVAVSSELQGLLCSFVRESVIYIPVEGLDQGLKKNGTGIAIMTALVYLQVKKSTTHWSTG